MLNNTTKKKRIPLHVKILIGLLLGLIYGLVGPSIGIPLSFTMDYIKPIGTIFVNGLKMIAMPLVLSSLIVGVANLGDVSKLSRMGGKTIALYLCTTVIAISIGLIVVNLLNPGNALPEDTRTELMEQFAENVQKTSSTVASIKEESPLKPIVDMVPSNIVLAAGNNGAMLQVVFFAIIMGIALLKVSEKKARPVIGFFEGINEVTIQIVEFIMILAPYGVFALIASLNADLDLLVALGKYSLTVLIGLAAMVFIVYPLLFKLFTKIKYVSFFKGIRPAQLLAFSTSSSSATLPVTMDRCEKHLGVSEEVSSFVLPLGATINMDGTSLYQGIAAVFIAQALGMDLNLGQQLTIVLTATLASIGTAGVPGAGIVMLLIILQSIGVPAAGVALIMGPDRILDMCRTMVNVTGDATVATIVASSEGELKEGIEETEQLVS
ncbi:dicarboxylate/amino acid:cation symporter [Xanthovirga aplysinae]|uniref:dicarboxylate/amino acid:cation symporter n=1 Tax=Xanthovirga aplysinae TaxID=2529853 RepID=UPI0012BBB229|nr:dicarboxylate/amino acid:cation symporter [Xanthovirga aplysinae]MTI31297.1 dicarboxylate/amino acid:cation symporter [Xanthovirga aplysinae]